MSLDQALLLPPGYGFDASPAWTYASEPSLAEWLDPPSFAYSDAGTTLAVPTDPLYRWKSKASANFVQQTTLGNRPIYNGTNVQFTNASGHTLSGTFAVEAWGSADFTVSIWYQETTQTLHGIFAINDGGNPGGYLSHRRDTNILNWRFWSGSAYVNRQVTASYSANAWQNVIITYQHSTTTTTVLLNGTSVGAVSSAVLAGNNKLLLGVNNDGFDRLTGKIGPVAVFTSVLSAETIAKIVAQVPT